MYIYSSNYFSKDLGSNKNQPNRIANSYSMIAEKRSKK